MSKEEALGLNEENFSLQLLKKKTKNKSKEYCAAFSQRKNITVHLTSDNIPKNVLIEKKKNYSNAIRERNLEKIKSKKNSIDAGHVEQSTNNINCKENRPVKDQKKIKSLKNSGVRKNVKNSHNNLSVLDFQPIPKTPEQQEAEIFHTSLYYVNPPPQKHQNHIKPKYQYQNKPNKLTLCQQTINLTVQQQFKDITILEKQNATFKRDLANYRKQSMKLKKLLENQKMHNKEIQEKAQILSEQLKCKQMCKGNIEEVQESSKQENIELINQYRSQIANLNSIKASLELKLCMNEKKYLEEISNIRKKMAKDICVWREKATKLRAQNMMYKSSHHDFSLSMNISNDDE